MILYCIPVEESTLGETSLDMAVKIATIVIAGFNTLFAVYIFVLNWRRDTDKTDRSRRLSLFQSLILDHSMKYFYSIYDSVLLNLEQLMKEGLGDDEKARINQRVGDDFAMLRTKFYDSLLAVDGELYNAVIKRTDQVQDDITNAIFDNGVNLSHSPKFDELVRTPLAVAKTDVLRILFNYRG